MCSLRLTWSTRFAFDDAEMGFLQTLCYAAAIAFLSPSRVQRWSRLLCLPRERPRRSGASEERDELAPSHSTANSGDHFTGPRVSNRRGSVRGAKSHFATRQTP